MWAWLVARGNGKGVSLERHGERAGGSEVFRQEKANREGRVQVVIGSSGTFALVTGPGLWCSRPAVRGPSWRAVPCEDAAA